MFVRLLVMKDRDGIVPIGLAYPGAQNVRLWTMKGRKTREINVHDVSQLTSDNLPSPGSFQWGPVVEASDEYKEMPFKVFEAIRHPIHH